MTDEDKEHWRQIWRHATRLSGSKGKPWLGAWQLICGGTEALLATGKADPGFISDTVFQVAKSLEVA